MLNTEYFYNIDGEREGEPEGFVNEVDNIIGKTVNCFTLNKSGLEMVSSVWTLC